MNIADEIYSHLLQQKNGFFVDCGAHNGVWLSKTKCFEDNGWDGICIEPNPKLSKLLQVNRKGSLHFDCALSDVDDEIAELHYCGRTEEMSGSGSILPYDSLPNGRHALPTHFHKCTTKTLNTLFLENNITHVDFLKTDLEGMDARVLLNLNFHNVSVSLLCYEMFPAYINRPKMYALPNKTNTILEKHLTDNGFVKLLDNKEQSKYFKGIDMVWVHQSFYDKFKQV